MSSKLSTSIRDKFARKTKASPNLFLVKDGCLFSSDIGATRRDDSGFGNVAVNKDSDSIETTGFRKFHDEIHGDSGERSGIRFRSDGLKRWMRTIRKVLGFLPSRNA